MKTEEGNKLIAEFMDVSDFTLNEFNRFLVIRNAPYTGFFNFTETKYHSSWSWLMPVVERIQSKGYDVNIFNDEDGEQAMIWGAGFSYSRDPASLVVENCPGVGNSKIVTVWDTVIKFIQWYNQ